MADEPAVQTLELAVSALRRRCDSSEFNFATTTELAAVAGPVGQARAQAALAFGLGIKRDRFNVYVSGPEGTGKTTAVREILSTLAPAEPTPDDWCYVHNHSDPSRPRALRLAAGQGRRLRDRLRELVKEARRKIPRAFESDEYATQREAIMGEFNRHRDQGMQELTAHAQQAGFILQPTPTGLTLIPTMGNRPLTEDDVQALRPEMREVIDRSRAEIEQQVQSFMRGMMASERETRERLEAQDRDVTSHAVSEVVETLLTEYTDDPVLRAYLETVREEVLADIGLFRSHPLSLDANLPAPAAEGGPDHALHERAFRKYEVNLVVDHSDTKGAPVVFEPNPTYGNLIGRIEREAVMGALMTDVTLIGAGALHRANGGYLLLRLADLVRSPLSWEALKRCLRERCISIEEPSEMMGLGTTRGLQPETIPLSVKVVLLGEPRLFGLLGTMDPDFHVHFKVRADFDGEIERSAANELALAAVMGTAAAQSGLPLDSEAVALLVEESSRMASDQQKLSARLGPLTDLVSESAYWAQSGGSVTVGAEHVRIAIEQRTFRSASVSDRLQEMVTRGTILIRPEGLVVGQIHGLAVLEAGGAVFGRPSRITATIGAGRDGVVDIERLVELGGPIHSKGVLILAGFLADVYAQDKPLALSARLVFEQSYEGIEGDSASLAELLVLLSRIADVPIRQELAVTGSVNQRGEVQAVGGVNEKIEGFFDVCAAAGLSGTQGVVLPASNIGNLMLRPDVLDAVENGRFHVYGVRSVDQAIELVTGVPAGARERGGAWPAASVHARVDARLRSLAEALRAFSAPDEARSDGRRPRAGSGRGPAHERR